MPSSLPLWFSLRREDMGIEEKTKNGAPATGDAASTKEDTIKPESEPTPEPSEQRQQPRLRVSTRTQAHLDFERELLARHKCLRWKNTAAIRAIGHCHIDSDIDVINAAAAASKGSATGNRKRKLLSSG
ncbi:hypothetical protein KEM56_006168, partial [Ascosphaera pollenicola]